MPVSLQTPNTNVWELLPPEIRKSLIENEPILSRLSVARLSSDSRQVQPGDLFFAMPGTVKNGSEYIEQALEKGAVLVLAEDKNASCCYFDEEKKIIYLPFIAPWVGIIAAAFYGWPSRDLTLVAITGTNGKTTTSYICASLGEKLGLKTAIMGTNGYGPLHEVKSQQLTTPDPIRLQAQLAELRDSGIELVAMEISSHALVQYRVNGCHFDVALLTNISRDHLDYHGDIDSYALAKATLMSWFDLGAVVINIDDEYAPLFERFSSTQHQWFYSFSAEYDRHKYKSDQMCIISQSSKGNTHKPLQLSLNKKDYRFPTNLVGRFNDQNLTAALLAFVALGFDLDSLQPLTADLFIPQGRMQTVNPEYLVQQQAQVVVDFAHTPDAMNLILKELKEICGSNGRLCVVFGCGGDRDRGKRPLMANVAEDYGDLIFVTQDNPRFESNEQIFEDIFAGFSEARLAQQGSSLIRCDDRKEAISKAIQQSKPQDIVVILGKGHEKYQEIAGHKSAFDDVEIARQALTHYTGI